jgi:sulfite reductase (NADPH) flavoprotein alpha-component
MNIKILFGTETGNAEEAANVISQKLNEASLSAEVLDMSKSSLEDIKNCDIALISTSTWGDGEAPTNAMTILESISAETNTEDLSGVKFAVFALGDSMYPNFCQAGEDFDNALSKLGAERIAELCKNEDDFYQNIAPWVEQIINAIK